MTEQIVVNVWRDEGQYHNFFWSPGSCDSLKGYLKSGWLVKFIKDDPENEKACIIFERSKND